MSTRGIVKKHLEALKEFAASKNGLGVCCCGINEMSHDPLLDGHAYVDSHYWTLDLLQKEYDRHHKLYRDKVNEYRRLNRSTWKKKYNLEESAAWMARRLEEVQARKLKEQNPSAGDTIDKMEVIIG